jgi:hypothetical protein
MNAFISLVKDQFETSIKAEYAIRISPLPPARHTDGTAVYHPDGNRDRRPGLRGGG